MGIITFCISEGRYIIIINIYQQNLGGARYTLLPDVFLGRYIYTNNYTFANVHSRYQYVSQKDDCRNRRSISTEPHHQLLIVLLLYQDQVFYSLNIHIKVFFGYFKCNMIIRSFRQTFIFHSSNPNISYEKKLLSI